MSFPEVRVRKGFGLGYCPKRRNLGVGEAGAVAPIGRMLDCFLLVCWKMLDCACLPESAFLFAHAQPLMSVDEGAKLCSLYLYLLDKAPRPSISDVIWILSSDTVSSTTYIFSNSEAAMLSSIYTCTCICNFPS